VGEKKAAIQQQIDGLVARASMSSELDGDYGVVWMYFFPLSQPFASCLFQQDCRCDKRLLKESLLLLYFLEPSHCFEFYALEWCLI
jgi:hypothetical protein